MEFYNICTKKSYTKKDGTEKVLWPQVGTLRITDDGKKFLELNMFPNTPLYVFDQKPREEKSPADRATNEDDF